MREMQSLLSRLKCIDTTWYHLSNQLCVLTSQCWLILADTLFNNNVTMFSSNNYVLLRNVCQYVCFKSLASDRCIINFINWKKLIKLYIPRKLSGPRADRRSAPATDSLRDVWWTVSRNYTVLFLSRDVKNTKFNQYLPIVLTSLRVQLKISKTRIVLNVTSSW